jgi:HAD superfamily hydrolase (TIGR01509 family)
VEKKSNKVTDMKDGSQQKSMAFIWDLDGTLLDSYEIIVSNLYKTYLEFNIELDKAKILKEIITHSVNDYLSKLEKETGIGFAAVRSRLSEINDREKLNIKPIKNAAEILSFLKDRGIPNYVFTHRGATTETVLKNTGLYGYFDDIVTGNDGFGRKPDPSALLYLIQKHNLDRENTYYVGDRSLDIECAENAGTKSILYLPENSAASPTGKETFVVKDLLDIQDIVRGLTRMTFAV